jgi:2'-hydroxyisoflavone reductase
MTFIITTDSSRRAFLAQGVGLAAGALLISSAGGVFAMPNSDDAKPAAGKSLRILILGGTGFLGPAVVEAAKARGHSLTLFNRGKTEKRIGTIDGVEKLFGNRDPNLHSEEKDETSPKGLSQIEDAIASGTKWDAVVDTSGYVPRIVKASAEALAKASDQYVFISTISVYANNNVPNEDESGEIAKTDTPTSEDVQQLYGPLKALCEQAAEEAMPGRVTNIRPGFIVGRGDPTDRFICWPWRVTQGGEMLVPGTPDTPVQFVDVRDLAEFVVRCIERKTMGVYNVTGPNKGKQDLLTQAQFLAASASAAKAIGKTPATPVYAPWSWLETYMQTNNLPVNFGILVPAEGDSAGFAQRNCAKAVAAGLTFRTAADTCADAIAWWPKEVERRTRVGNQMLEDDKAAGKPPRASIEQLIAMRAGVKSEQEAAMLKVLSGK